MLRTISALLLTLTACSLASAHFAWLDTTEDALPRLFFGEGLDDRDYHTPEAIASASVWQDGIDAPAKAIPMSPLEEEGFTGLEADQAIEPRGRLRTTVVYGIYHGSKLTYHAQHFASGDPKAWPRTPSDDAVVQAMLAVEGDQLVATVTLAGEPLAGARATLSRAESSDTVSQTTDDAGAARFPLDEVHEGLNALMVMHVVKGEEGEVDGDPYTSTTDILTATFNYSPEAAAETAALPPMPEAVSSFGAAVCDGWLYVYGGHTGQAHDHSCDNLATGFRRIRLDGEGEWQELAMGPRLQGLPLVAHGGKLYRVGGLSARNKLEDDEDLHSLSDFAAYDPATDTWTDLPALPQGRSSHNAVVFGDTLYVVGGWTLAGEEDSEWRSEALAFDLTDPDAAWRELSEPPFRRRALAVGHSEGSLVVLCGMSDEGEISQQTFLYDPATSAWSEGPEFPGRAFYGFGLSAWNLDGVLYAGGMEGVLYRLDAEAAGWTQAAEFANRRFFHQLVPDGSGGLLAIGGASPEVGHTATTERLTPSAPQ